MASRSLSALAAAVAATVLVSGSAMACYKPPVFDPAASVIVCGDPRVKATLDNSESNVAATFKLKFASGRDKSQVVAIKKVAPGAVKVTKFRWAHGSRPFVVKVWTDSGWTTLVRQNVRNATPWGVGACPVNRFQ